jgi:DNA-directed RNA polymerase I subunit RPA1
VANRKIELVCPAILKPKQLWTGKQLFTNIIKIVVDCNCEKKFQKGVFMEGKAKLNSDDLAGTFKDDFFIIVRDNELLAGVLDKNSLGSGSEFSLMHSFFEIYGGKITGKLFSAFAKLTSSYL